MNKRLSSTSQIGIFSPDQLHKKDCNMLEEMKQDGQNFSEQVNVPKKKGRKPKKQVERDKEE